jgi:defect-in-organelle-trafficking protein DotB
MRLLIEDPERHEKILEYSAPIEYVYDLCKRPRGFLPIAQTEVGRQLPTFARAARNALRRKPTIALIGEARDAETIAAVAELSITGHLVYTTMHTSGVAETVRRAIMVFPADERLGMAVDIMSALRMAVTQILVPRVGGGKVACREFLLFTPEVRGRFLEEPAEGWAALCRTVMAERAAPCQTMAEGAARLLEAGTISRETFDFVCRGERAGV